MSHHRRVSATFRSKLTDEDMQAPHSFSPPHKKPALSPSFLIISSSGNAQEQHAFFPPCSLVNFSNWVTLEGLKTRPGSSAPHRFCQADLKGKLISQTFAESLDCALSKKLGRGLFLPICLRLTGGVVGGKYSIATIVEAISPLWVKPSTKATQKREISWWYENM